MDDSYAISVEHGNVLVDDNTPQPQTTLLHDSDLQLERESRARSGNYLETIATELDNLKEMDNELIEAQLENLVAELLYVHERYELVKKTDLTLSTRL